MNGNTVISNVIPFLLLIVAAVFLLQFYQVSSERRRLLLAIGATFLASFCLAILIVEHI